MSRKPSPPLLLKDQMEKIASKVADNALKDGNQEKLLEALRVLTGYRTAMQKGEKASPDSGDAPVTVDFRAARRKFAAGGT